MIIWLSFSFLKKIIVGFFLLLMDVNDQERATYDGVHICCYWGGNLCACHYIRKVNLFSASFKMLTMQVKLFISWFIYSYFFQFFLDIFEQYQMQRLKEYWRILLIIPVWDFQVSWEMGNCREVLLLWFTVLLLNNS